MGAESRKKKEPLGAVAVRLGYVNDQQVQTALDEQRRRREQKQEILLGTLMQEMGVLSHDQLINVLQSCREQVIDISEDALSLALRLRSTLGDGNKIVMFTGATSGEGVSTVTEQVARASAMMGQGAILLLDANYRSSSLSSLYLKNGNGNGKSNGNGHHIDPPGLVEILDRVIEPKSGFHTTQIPRLWVMPTGSTSVDYVSRLMSPDFGRLMAELRKHCGMVLIDTPPLLEFPDAALIAPHCDGAVMIVKAHTRSQSEVLEMKHILDGLNVPILGVVLNEKTGPGKSRNAAASR